MDAAPQVPSRASICFISFCVLFHLLSLTASAAHRNGMGAEGGAAALVYENGPTCDCCHVSASSLCCLDCLAEVTSGSRSQLSPLTSGLLPAASEDLSQSLVGVGAGMEGEEGRGAAQGADSFLPGCRCCLSEVFSSRKMSLVLNACCSVCDRARRRAGLISPPLVPALPPATLLPSSQRRSDVSSDDVETGRLQKRMTSMDCMCCMNSGINDCCHKCRIF